LMLMALAAIAWKAWRWNGQPDSRNATR